MKLSHVKLSHAKTLTTAFAAASAIAALAFAPAHAQLLGGHAGGGLTGSVASGLGGASGGASGGLQGQDDTNALDNAGGWPPDAPGSGRRLRIVDVGWTAQPASASVPATTPVRTTERNG